jgi:Clr5 domain
MPTLSHGTESMWEFHKSTILDLYLTEDMTLEKVMAHMKQNHGFDARCSPHMACSSLDLTNFNSKGRYETQFRKWNLRKNLRSSEWKYVSHRIQKRKKEGKESVVYFNRDAIAPEKVKKEISRHDMPTYQSGNPTLVPRNEVDELTTSAAPTPKTPNEVSVCTPAPAATAPSPDDLQVASETAPLPSYGSSRTDKTYYNLRTYPVFC